MSAPNFSQLVAFLREGLKRKPPLARHSSHASSASARVGIFLLLLLAAQAQADMPSLADRDALISWVLERYWGHARDSTGTLIQPSSDLERRTVPIPTAVAYRALEAGEISGLAAWCDLDWESHYRSITAAARQRGMPDKKVAFISFLHGAAQGIALKAQSSPCSGRERQEVRAKLKSSMSIGLASNKSLRSSPSRPE
jgi:hypothetical protein